MARRGRSRGRRSRRGGRPPRRSCAVSPQRLAPTYVAMREVGRAKKAIFVARYLRLRDLQREIEDGLNVWESSDGHSSRPRAAGGGEAAGERRDG
ncbi:Tn3 family transposase [Streptomyces sp. NPDC048516]|uniref:Tn3 family transposase n=1 Tax=Streptomyces sp. NPDC048516 TaxID=3365565 RepID=UPI00371C6EA6